MSVNHYNYKQTISSVMSDITENTSTNHRVVCLIT